MKKRFLTFTIILIVIFLIVASAIFFIRKYKCNDEKIEHIYDTSTVIDKISFLKFNEYDAIKKYADNSSICIGKSNYETFFSIDELYINENPVMLVYMLNSDGTLNRFDGSYSLKTKDKSVVELEEFFWHFDTIIENYFNVEMFEHCIYNEDGAQIDSNAYESYKLLLNGKARYGLSVIDKANTYWYIDASVSNKEQIDFNFFRCFDLSFYNDDSPNIDLRELEEIGE